LIRLLLNQIGRRLTEDLSASSRHRVLLMLDEFPALGRLDFFESALAFMAGYGLKAFLIAQSLNQIEKAYGPNNAILDNCHVRVSFATNDERTAKRVSDALGAATELRAMKNYAGHRLSPWLGHVMISRQETARALLTPGEIMQLPPADELVLVAGCPPIRAKKARYFADPRLKRRITPPPENRGEGEVSEPVQATCPHDWSALPRPLAPAAAPSAPPVAAEDGGLRWEAEPEAPDLVVPEAPTPTLEPELPLEDETDDLAALQARFRRVARQAALDPDDGLGL
jgi:type IV secretion system protein VirD4